MDTEFKITSGTTDFTATIDRSARKVKLLAMETVESAECGGVTDWPTAETPDWEAVHLAIEAHFGCWIEKINLNWSATETANEAVLAVRFCKEQPTHRVTVTGNHGVEHVDIVRLDKIHESAYTHAEWDDAAMPTWRVRYSRWSKWDEKAPSGTIRVEVL